MNIMNLFVRYDGARLLKDVYIGIHFCIGLFRHTWKSSDDGLLRSLSRKSLAALF